MFLTQVFVIFIVFLIMRHKSLSRKSNIKRHLSDGYSYAHFSKIDSDNYYLFPELIFTSPRRYTLEAGESIYIPPKWWHWIRTEPDTFAVNFWADEMNNCETPYKCKAQNSHTHESIVHKLKDKIYTSKQIRWNHRTDVINDSETGYIITLPGYITPDSQMNSDLVKYVDESIIPDTLVNPEINVWISTDNAHDTGLHYDDKHGILTVLCGIKNITLFPPSDTKYLHAHDTKPWWVTVPPRKVEYNAYHEVCKLPNTQYPSSRLLYESLHTAKHRDHIIRHINWCARDTVWGCKQMYNSPDMRWEMYKYHYNLRSTSPVTSQKKIIASKDYYDTHNVIGPDTHEYYRVTELTRPFVGYGTKNNIERESLFVLDDANRFRMNAKQYTRNIGLEECPIYIFDKYKCKDLVCWNKFDGNYFIQFLGISIDDFIDFLGTHNYPHHLVDHVRVHKDKYKDVVHEITIVYDKDGKVVRSGFYGII